MDIIRKISQKSIRNTSFSTSIRMPSHLFGVGLGIDEEIFQKIKDRFTYLVNLNRNKTGFSEAEVSALINVSDGVDFVLQHRERTALAILTEFFDYLRAKLLSEDVTKIRAAINVADSLIKNASSYKVNAHYIYHLASNERFLKTLSRRVKQLLTTPVPTEMRACGKLGLDCIQAWGEAFSTQERKHVYNFLHVYEQLRDKHHMIFPRPPFDPERVPIFLAHFGSEERDFQLQEGRYESREEAKAEPSEPARAPVPSPPTQEDLLGIDLMNQEPSLEQPAESPQQSPDKEHVHFPDAEPPTWFTEPAAEQGQLVLAPVGAMHGAQPMQMQQYNPSGNDMVQYQYPTFEQMRQQQQQQQQLLCQQQYLEQQRKQYQAFLQQQTAWHQPYNYMGFPQQQHQQQQQQPMQQPPAPPQWSGHSPFAQEEKIWQEAATKKTGLDALSNGVHALLKELPRQPPLRKSSVKIEEHVFEPDTPPPRVPLERRTSEPQSTPPPAPALASPQFAPPQDPSVFPSAAGPPPACFDFTNNPFDAVTDSSSQSEPSTQTGAEATFAAKLAAFENTGRDSSGRTDSGGTARTLPKVDIRFIGNTRVVTDQKL